MRGQIALLTAAAAAATWAYNTSAGSATLSTSGTATSGAVGQPAITGGSSDQRTLRSLASGPVEVFVTSGASAPGKIILYAERGKPAAEGITFTDVRVAADALKSDSAQLLFAEKDNASPNFGASTRGFDVPAGQAKIFEVRVKEDAPFPAGKTKGRILVRSPSVPEPLLVDYVVFVRRSAAWIAICALVGGAAGWFVRVRLQAQHALYVAAAEASKMMAVLNDAAKAGDNDFLRRVDDVRNGLQREIRSNNPETIRAAIATATRDLASAEQLLEQACQRLAQELTPLHDALAGPWLLPPTATRELQIARALSGAVLQHVSTRHLARAREIFEGDFRQSLRRVADAAGEWRAQCADYLQKLLACPPTMIDGGYERLEGAIKEWTKNYGDFLGIGRLSGVQLEKALGDAHAARHRAAQIVEKMGGWGGEMTAWACKELNDVPAATANALSDTIASHARQYCADLDDPAGAVAALSLRRDQQREAWRNFFGAALDVAKLPSDIEAEITKGHWQAVVEEIVRLKATPTRIQNIGMPVVTGPATNSAPPAAGAIQQPTASPSVARAPLVAFLPALGPVSGTLREQEIFVRQATTASLFQSACIAVVFTGAAYAFFGESWSGTWRDMFIVFSWAFALDLTADVAGSLLRGIGERRVA